MKHRIKKAIFPGMLLALLLTSVCLGACDKRQIPAPETGCDTTAPTAAPMETVPSQGLEDLLGEDYVQFLTDTITMQMGNRMDKNPDVPYFTITDKAPLNDYVTIGEETAFAVDDEGYLTILFPGGTVAAPEHGEQCFRIIKIAEKGERIS